MPDDRRVVVVDKLLSQFHAILISRYLSIRIAILSTQPVQSISSPENVNANIIKLAETIKHRTKFTSNIVYL